MIRTFLTTFFATMVCLAVSPAMAQHSDVEFEYGDGQIVIEGGADLFEAEFPTSGASQNFTIDPGFASEVDEGLGVGANDDIFIRFVSSPNASFGPAPLLYHDGDGFASTAASISVEDNSTQTSDLGIFETGFTGDNPVFLGTADSTGDIHTHVDFILSSGAAQGAYGVLFELESSNVDYENSDPVLIVFNHGLDEDVFEDVVIPAFSSATAVPEPSSLIVMGIGTFGLILRRRRRE